MTDTWTDKLSEYVDGDLDAETRQALDAHLLTCASCRATRDELMRVVARARTGGYREPQHDLWPSVEASITRTPRLVRRPRLVTFTLGRLAAAAGLVAVVAGGFAWTLASRRTAARPLATAVGTGSGTPVGKLDSGSAGA